VTTHIDAPTIEALAGALRKFEGAVVLITHDRSVPPFPFIEIPERTRWQVVFPRRGRGR
jgi:ATPase subunit of ABC transporter with duplicated ATPase domains